MSGREPFSSPLFLPHGVIPVGWLCLHFTPTSGSWLNQVERWFAKITEQRIRRGVFKNIDQLIAAIDEFIACNNENPKPFIWTATPELILDRIGRLCKRTNRSAH